MAKPRTVYFISGEVIEVYPGQRAHGTLKRAIQQTHRMWGKYVPYKFSKPFTMEEEQAWIKEVL